MKLKRKGFPLKESLAITDPVHLFQLYFPIKLFITFNKPFDILFVCITNIGIN